MNGEALRLPLPVEPTVKAGRSLALTIALLDETRAAERDAVQEIEAARKRAEVFGKTRSMAEEALSLAIARKGAIEHDGRIYRATPQGRITIEHLPSATRDGGHHARP